MSEDTTYEDFPISKLRSKVTLARRVEDLDPTTGEPIYSYTDPLVINTWIEQTKGIPWLRNSNVEIGDDNFTMVCRWRDFSSLTDFHFILRRRIRVDGSIFNEIFKINGVLELHGRRRFCQLDLELQKHLL
jgi:hypothetical protein